jgi:NADH:ubiquinone oxidoreductase subunit E
LTTHVVKVCAGPACRKKGARALLEQAGTEHDGVRVRECTCLGSCDEAPAVMEDGELVGGLTPQEFEEELARLSMS